MDQEPPDPSQSWETRGIPILRIAGRSVATTQALPGTAHPALLQLPEFLPRPSCLASNVEYDCSRTLGKPQDLGFEYMPQSTGRGADRDVHANMPQQHTHGCREGWLSGVGRAGRVWGAWRGAYSGVKSVSCVPSGAWTRALRSPHGVMTGGATCTAPAATSRRAMSSLSATFTASRTVPDTRRPTSIASTD